MEGRQAHAEYHPHELHHRHHGGVRPHVQGDERVSVIPPGAAQNREVSRSRSVTRQMKNPTARFKAEKGGHHRQIGPNDPGADVSGPS